MLSTICPKLPMREKAITKAFYVNKLGFQEFGMPDFEEYLMIKKDKIEIHFFGFKKLNPQTNYGQVYIRTENIEDLFQTFLDKKIIIHPNGYLQEKPWKQKEFSLLDPDNNLLTFGEAI